jgi:hypothetical protein
LKCLYKLGKAADEELHGKKYQGSRQVSFRRISSPSSIARVNLSTSYEGLYATDFSADLLPNFVACQRLSAGHVTVETTVYKNHLFKISLF